MLHVQHAKLLVMHGAQHVQSAARAEQGGLRAQRRAQHHHARLRQAYQAREMLTTGHTPGEQGVAGQLADAQMLLLSGITLTLSLASIRCRQR